MDNQLTSEKVVVKTAYTTPTLIEYGSLAEKTRLFGLPDLDSSNPNDIVGSITSLAL